MSAAVQKLMRRVATAERVAAKRKKVKDTKYFKKGRKEEAGEALHQTTVAEAEFRRAKQAVRDAWRLGPLAPREDVGEWAGARGAIHQARFPSVARLSPAMRDARCAWAGGARNLNLVPGDRVVLLEGPDRGKIGRIASVIEDAAAVTVDGLNKSNMRIGPEIRGPTDPPAVNIELPLPISAIRLVHPLTDPETGATRDVIINQLVHSGMVTDRVSGRREWSRVVPGLNVSIPWPARPEEEAKDHEGDTLRIDAEKRTFVPTLLRPPMPAVVIDELRGRYSRFRTRHEPEYVARLEAEERAREEQKRLVAESMRTPLQEFHRAERAGKKKKGKPRLTLEMLEKIGEVIARNRELSLNKTTTTTTTIKSSGGSGGGDDDDGSGGSSFNASASTTTADASPLPGQQQQQQQTESQPPPSSSSSSSSSASSTSSTSSTSSPPPTPPSPAST